MEGILRGDARNENAMKRKEECTRKTEKEESPKRKAIHELEDEICAEKDAGKLRDE